MSADTTPVGFEPTPSTISLDAQQADLMRRILASDHEMWQDYVANPRMTTDRAEGLDEMDRLAPLRASVATGTLPVLTDYWTAGPASRIFEWLHRETLDAIDHDDAARRRQGRADAVVCLDLLDALEVAHDAIS